MTHCTLYTVQTFLRWSGKYLLRIIKYSRPPFYLFPRICRVTALISLKSSRALKTLPSLIINLGEMSPERNAKKN